MSEVLTYETIREIYRREQQVPKLTKLPDDFFEKVREYLAVKLALLKKDGDTSADTEFQNTINILQHVLEIREKKIMSLSFFTVRTGIPPENLTMDEKEFFDKIIKELKAFRIKREKLIEPEKTKSNMKLVAFLDNMESFVGEDMKTYGPFRAGDVATIPYANAKLLIEAGNVEEMKIDINKTK